MLVVVWVDVRRALVVVERDERRQDEEGTR